jgi:photosystem II stability/assembly factor-like uncharacterized protein
MRRLLPALAVAFAFLGPVRPLAAGSWWRLPIWGGDIRSIATDPFDAQIVYCGTARGNVYLSRDGGLSWAPARGGAMFPGYVVSALVADPEVPGRLWGAFAGEYQGAIVAVSQDRGENWTVLARWVHAVAARALALAPGKPGEIAIGGDDGVRLSHDGGRTWIGSGTSEPGLRLVESLAFDPSDSETLYAGTYRQAFRTEDGGRTWSRIADGMVLDATVYSWAFSRNDPRDVWVSTCGWVYHSEDGGGHWIRATEGFTNRRTHAILRDPGNPSILYAGTVGGLHRSEDGGRTWRRITRDSLVVRVLAADARTGRLFVGTEGEGLYVSDDEGTTLTPASAGIAEARVSGLTLDPGEPDRVFFYRSYAGDQSGVWAAEGDEVQRLSRQPLAGSFSLAAFRVEGRTILLLSSPSELRVSTDLGASFHAAARPPQGSLIAVFGTPLPVPMAVTDRGVFTSRDGERWERIDSPAGRLSEARIASDGSGSPALEVDTASGRFRLERGRWIEVPRALLGGGIFLKPSRTEQHPLDFFQATERGGLLKVEDPRGRYELTLPREGIRISGTVQAGNGWIYLATMSDGLYLFKPDRADLNAVERAGG